MATRTFPVRQYRSVLESLSINLDGYTHDEEVLDAPYIDFYALPSLDLANLTDDSQIIDFDSSNGCDYLNFNVSYSLWAQDDIDGDYQQIGDAWQDYNIDQLGFTRDNSNINIWNQQEALENNEITAYLNYAHFNGNYKYEVENEHGNIPTTITSI